jgi:signal transduction histidine kinase
MLLYCLGRVGEIFLMKIDRNTRRFYRLILAREDHWVLAAMLIFLHVAMWWDFPSPLSRCLMLAHLGLFLVWQPLWGRDKQLDWSSGALFFVFSLAFIYWLDWWLLFCWLLLLAGLVGGLPLYNKHEHYAYMATLAFLVSDLLIGCVTQLFEVRTLTHEVRLIFQYGLLLVPLGMGFLSADPRIARSPLPVDFFRALTVSLIIATLAISSLLNMYRSDVTYSQALSESLLGLAAFLFVISWLLSPKAGFTGFAQFWERSLLNIGTPFEDWLGDLSRLAARIETPEQFLDASMRRLLELPWLEGVAWNTGDAEVVCGPKTANKIELGSDALRVTLYSRNRVGSTLFLHCHLLVKLLVHFYTAKLREQELAQQAHLQAIYETGARVTHDIKNLLQSLYTLTLVLEQDGHQESGRQLLRRQLPHIIERLRLALDKLQAPDKTLPEIVSVTAWWEGAKRRHVSPWLQLCSDPLEKCSIPGDLFDSVLDNLVENVQHKRLTSNKDLHVTVSLVSTAEEISLTVHDDGDPLDPRQAKRLFKQPLPSATGLGIGLYQAKRQAETLGYELLLKRNEPGQVCFELRAKKSGGFEAQGGL